MHLTKVLGIRSAAMLGAFPRFYSRIIIIPVISAAPMRCAAHRRECLTKGFESPVALFASSQLLALTRLVCNARRIIILRCLQGSLSSVGQAFTAPKKTGVHPRVGYKSASFSDETYRRMTCGLPRVGRHSARSSFQSRPGRNHGVPLFAQEESQLRRVQH